ncbi:MAG: rRNA maturation RNase YbeY [Pseudomonadota bacterium]
MTAAQAIVGTGTGAGAEADDAPVVDLVVETEAWVAALPDLAALGEIAAAAALSAAGLAPGDHEIALLACDDARITALNTDFRGKPQPTNVLSWPTHPLAPPAPGRRPPPPPAPGPLGDVAIALETCIAEAEAAGLPLKDHVVHLILHGCLHLLGFDHRTDADAALMEEVERRQLARLGIADPYREGEAGGPRS